MELKISSQSRALTSHSSYINFQRRCILVGFLKSLNLLASQVCGSRICLQSSRRAMEQTLRSRPLFELQAYKLKKEF